MHFIGNIYAGSVTRHFLHICTRVMALDLRLNLVFAQYLEIKLKNFTKFHICILIDKISLKMFTNHFFADLYQSYGPWFTPEFCFCSISWEQIGIISPNYIYAFILIRYRLGFFHIILFQICTRVMALDLRQNFVSAQYLENKLADFHQIVYLLTWIYLAFVSFYLLLIYNRVWPLINARISFPLNIFRTIGQILSKLYITIYIDKV